jgi:hypothetical protein
MIRTASNPSSVAERPFFDTVYEWNSRLLEIALDAFRANLDYARKLMSVQSPSEFVDLTSNYLRDQFETMSERMDEMQELMRQAEPAGMGGAENEIATFFE